MPFLPLPLLAPAPPTADVDFLLDVWPILEARCIQCHGPDKQKGDLRFDTRAGLFGEDSEYPPVVPGDLEASEMWFLVNLPADDVDVMPAEGDPLTADQLAVLREWIEGGAVWAQPEVAEPEPDPLALPPLTEEQAAARRAALERLAGAGVYALPVAVDHPAVDVNLSLLRDGAGDGTLELLRGLEPVLVWLDLSGTAVGDAGLQHVARFGELRRLDLSKTAVTDAGLARLAGLERLRYLNLYGTAVTDAGLRHLEGLKGLEKIFLWRTAVTDEGAAALARALPELQIDRGIAPPPPPDPAAPVNSACPVSGEGVDPAVTSAYRGRVVGFCCGTCKAKFDADPESFAGKLPPEEEPPPEQGSGPINDACPVSGQPVDPAHTVTFRERTVGFCCPKCRKAFEKEPEKYAEKLDLGGR